MADSHVYNDILFEDCRKIKLTTQGKYLRAHTNYVLIKFLDSFRKTNTVHIDKTIKILNNFISISKDQLKESKGLDLLPLEKEKLKKDFNNDKHHIIISCNVFMFLIRHELILLDI